MGRIFIFANGIMDEPPAIIQSISPTDLIIAANGGTKLCISLGITPQVIIGDFDSLDTQTVANYKQVGVETIQYPSHKDETDLELALQLAMKRGFGEVYIIGALGARWDMTVANIMLIAHPAFSAMKIHILEGKQELVLLHGEEQFIAHGRPGDPISLIPLAGDANGITTHGLEYPLKNETLYFGSSRGVSNSFLQNQAQIEIKEGVLLCIFNWADN